MELTPVQRDILTALINIYRKEGRAVRGEEIAGLTDRSPGTVRNQMQSLKALNLVEGVPGPKGGYKATGSAHEALNVDATGDVVAVPIVKNGVAVDGASATEIVFNKVMKTKECDGIVRMLGNVKDFNVGDEIRIGPTPAHKLYIHGDVTGRDDTMSRLLFHVKGIISMPRIPVKKIAQRAVHIDPNATIQKAARILIHNGVREALVDESPPGLVSMTDIIRAFAGGRTNLAISAITTHGFLTIDSEEPIYEAIKVLGRNSFSQLVVLESGTPWGVVTPADLIGALSPS
jgi:predicted transcriptional regulator